MRLTRRGFTLIEVLVVVAIIALLAGILTPSLSAARRAGKRASCLHNLHQIGIAVQAYLPSNRDAFPSACRFKSSNPQNLPTIARVLKNEFSIRMKSDVDKKLEVFECPADVWSPDQNLPRESDKYFQTQDTSYEWFTELNGLRRRAKDLVWLYGIDNELTKVRASSMWMMRDIEYFHGGRNADKSQNVLFADLHVESVSPPRSSTPPSP